MHLSISATAIYLGVSISTVRRWGRKQILAPDYRTAGGHRRYSLKSLKAYCGQRDSGDSLNLSKKTILYSRVSGADQKSDLARQSQRLVEFSEQAKYENILVIEDLGSGVNDKKSGLKKLLKMLLDGDTSRLVLHHKDRLLRFGSELIVSICKHLGVEVVILEKSMDSSFEQELAADVIEIMTVFSARLYGRRSHQNRLKYSVKKAA